MSFAVKCRRGSHAAGVGRIRFRIRCIGKSAARSCCWSREYHCHAAHRLASLVTVAASGAPKVVAMVVLCVVPPVALID